MKGVLSAFSRFWARLSFSDSLAAFFVSLPLGYFPAMSTPLPYN